MAKVSRAVVWLKKDLRVSDHEALYRATLTCQEVVALYIVEPQWLRGYEFETSHLQFVLASLADLTPRLSQLGIPLIIEKTEALTAFTLLKKRLPFTHLFSHEETGVDLTFQRDKVIAHWCRENQIQWQEFPQFGVARGLRNRDQWINFRRKIIERPLFPTPRQLSVTPGLVSSPIPHITDFSCPPSERSSQQTGGETAGTQALESFLSGRGRTYLQDISSPALAVNSGSRLSPYLSFGNLSMRQIHHRLQAVKRAIGKDPVWRKSLWAFENRLWWHCHFIQKLESEPEIEYQNVNRAFDGLREAEFDPVRFTAFTKGETGYPLIDACVRSLRKSGWLNFRMRAMLVSFSSYHLWLHWQKPAEFLAKHFLDFEPGIHFSQVQMQSGVTGINTIRIYSPIKQTLDQREIGGFIRTHCPELQNVPDEFLHDLETMPPLLRIEANLRLGESYPLPIVDHQTAYKTAKERIFAWRRQPAVAALARDVLRKHASRKNAHFPNQDRSRTFGNLKKN